MSSIEEALRETEELEEEESTEVENDDNSSFDGLTSASFAGATTSNFASLYKATTLMTQEKRREALLQAIKLRRSKTVDDNRGFSELFNEEPIEDSEMEEQEPQEEAMEVDVKRKRRRRRRKRKNCFGAKLMMSEWFTEIPGDLENNWLVKLCPVGTRNLVVAHDKITMVYNKKGQCRGQFVSDLPGGGPQHSYGRFTVLDCIFNAEARCYYVLDVLAWNNCSLKSCDTDLRFYWLKSKLHETPELRQKTAPNKHCFYEIESFPAELPLIQDKLSRPYMVNDESVPLDGVLFYHRETDYIESFTPLVGWLKPYMIPEMLHIPVDNSFLEMKPDNYTSLQQYLDSRKRRNKPVNKHEPVETVAVEME